MKLEKTQVERILEQKKIAYDSYSYPEDPQLTAQQIAAIVNIDPNRMFKTLVTVSNKQINYVYVIPANKELNLKKAAKLVTQKSIELVKAKQLLALTGYVHGGCSPIGMKKSFVTVIDESAKQFDKIVFSAGKVGRQVEVALEDLQQVIKVEFGSVTD
ncbi:MAG: Cys-tRNA(Pro) deacylase [Erysipelotrichaceae bacterium]